MKIASSCTTFTYAAFFLVLVPGQAEFLLHEVRGDIIRPLFTVYLLHITITYIPRIMSIDDWPAIVSLACRFEKNANLEDGFHKHAHQKPVS